MTIRSVPNTSDLKCRGGCSSWLDHWERNTGRSATGCIISGCWRGSDVGAHVKEVGKSKVYIIPMCMQHNASEEAIPLDDTQRSNMIDADVQDTCGPGKSLADLLDMM